MTTLTDLEEKIDLLTTAMYGMQDQLELLAEINRKFIKILTPAEKPQRYEDPLTLRLTELAKAINRQGELVTFLPEAVLDQMPDQIRKVMVEGKRCGVGTLRQAVAL